MNIFVKLMLIATIAFGLNACEDDVIKDYIPRNMVEAYLIVDQPIENIKILKSQPVFGKFDYSKALIRDAKVFIKGDGQVIALTIDAEGNTGYYDPAKSYLIKPNTSYKLEIELSDGTYITANTTTPGRTAWTIPVKDDIQ